MQFFERLLTQPLPDTPDDFGIDVFLPRYLSAESAMPGFFRRCLRDEGSAKCGYAENNGCFLRVKRGDYPSLCGE